MPNWIINELVAYNLDSAGKTALEIAFKHDEPFNKLFPMPKILDETRSPDPSCLDEILGQNVIQKTQDVNGTTISDFSEYMYRKTEWRKKIKEMGKEKVIELIHKDKSIDEHTAAQAELAVHAVEETGYSNWYDWRVDNWGVKWDIDPADFLNETLFEDEGLGNPDIIIAFYTPWGPPDGILKRLSEQYPNAKFIMRSADIDDLGNGVYFLSAEAGVINEIEIGDKKDFLERLLDVDFDADEDD